MPAETKSLAALIDELDTSRDTVARKVTEKILAAGSRAVSPLLKAANSHPSPKVRKWALEALGATGSKRAIPLLEEALTHEKMTVRFHALQGLKKAKAKASCRKIAKLLREDPSGGVRMAALEALITLRGPGSTEALRQALGDAKAYIRKAAQKALNA